MRSSYTASMVEHSPGIAQGLKRAYIAASLFNPFDRARNCQIAEALSLAGFEPLLPQDIKAPQTEDGLDMEYVYRECVALLERADIVIALVDGAEVDTGVAWEIGYAVAKQIPVFCLRTDSRKTEAKGVNVMIEYSAHQVVYSTGYTATVNDAIKCLCEALPTE